MTAPFAARISKVRYKPDLIGLRRKDDIMAEYLSCGFDVKEAAQKMGQSYSYGNALLQRIRKGLGAQSI